MIRFRSMKQATYKVRSIGGTLAVTLPQSILRIVPLTSGDEVSFTVAGAGNKEGPLIVIKPERRLKRNGAKK